MTSAEARFLRVAMAQAAAVATLAGLVGSFALTPLPLPFYGSLLYMGPEASGPAATAVPLLLQGLVLSLAVLYVVIPVAVTAYLCRYGDLEPLQYVLSGSIAVFLLPVLAGAVVAVIGANSALLVAILLLVVVLGTGVFAASNRDERTDTDARMPSAMFLNVALVCTVFVLYLVGAIGGAALGSGLVEQDRYGANVPQVQFEFNYTETAEGGLLSISHDGGDSIRADRLYVRGTGFSDHQRANQSGNAAWQGKTADRNDEDGSRQQFVVQGNSTTVGVTPDCEVRVVYERDVGATLDVFECPGETA